MAKRYLVFLLFISVACNIYLVNTLRTERMLKYDTEDIEPSVTLPDGMTYTLLRIIDGDTITIGLNDRVEYVRLLGIDAPETNDPGGTECYGTEATEHLRKLLSTGTIVLRFDSSQDVRDKYNRILAYVERTDGTDVGEIMLRDGFAREYTYHTRYTRRDVYLKAESDAWETRRGLWGIQECK